MSYNISPSLTSTQCYVPVWMGGESGEEWIHVYIWLSPLNYTALLIGYAAGAKLLQSCLTLCDPRDGSPPGSPVPGILQAKILERVAISFSNAWKWKVKVKSLSRVWLLATLWTTAYQVPTPIQNKKFKEKTRPSSVFLLVPPLFKTMDFIAFLNLKKKNKQVNCNKFDFPEQIIQQPNWSSNDNCSVL